MRDDESHGLLAHHAGCVHERHVEVVSNSQAREVVRRDALVERVVDRAAADFIGEQRRDIAPGVVKLGYGMLFVEFLKPYRLKRRFVPHSNSSP